MQKAKNKVWVPILLTTFNRRRFASTLHIACYGLATTTPQEGSFSICVVFAFLPINIKVKEIRQNLQLLSREIYLSLRDNTSYQRNICFDGGILIIDKYL